ncbi:MAG: carboxylesterase family protein [Flavobacteriales bacterium]|nr:carboxylesterase family protein [Flavobacteriales bacterium]
MFKHIYLPLLVRLARLSLRPLILCFIYPLFNVALSFGQISTDTVYTIKIERDISYGRAVDFAGNSRDLTLDLAYPVNDSPPVCGRPVIVVLHGGAFMAGSKSDSDVQRMMSDFAKRGYVALAPNYRKGMFNTDRDHSCAFSQLFNVEWNCLNVQDTLEWYRAWYRAVQDTRGAIRWLMQRGSTYSADRFNVYISGFSAGGFIALGVGYLDHSSELRPEMGDLDDARIPHVAFESGCIQKYQWDTSRNSMLLERPDLGHFLGDLNLDAPEYRIRGVGNFYGAVFYNLFDSSASENIPALYTFHQPNDLIVPYNAGQKVFQGYSNCLYSICQRGILNAPKVYSSTWMRMKAREVGRSGRPAPEIWFDSTTNRTDCLGQIANPSLGGHQLDNYTLRTRNMAMFFAEHYDSLSCTTARITEKALPQLEIYPNPFADRFFLKLDDDGAEIRVFDLFGRECPVRVEHDTSQEIYSISTERLLSGLYIIEITSRSGHLRTRPVFKQ